MVSPLLPLLLSAAYFGDVDQRPSSRLLDQDFGVGLRPDQLVLSRYGYYVPSIYYRPWADLLRQGSPSDERGFSSISLDKDAFKVTLDVQQFKPEEIEVKVVDRHIVIAASHEEKKDEHGLVSRQFVRRYVIPETVDPELVTSSISSDGVLTIRAPVNQPEEEKNVRKIKIELTGKPALKHNVEEEEKRKKDEEEGISITTEAAAESISSTTPEK